MRLRHLKLKAAGRKRLSFTEKLDLIRKEGKGALPNKRRNKPTSSYAQGIGKAHTGRCGVFSSLRDDVPKLKVRHYRLKERALKSDN